MPFPWLLNINLQGSFEALLLPGNRSCVLWQCGLRCTLGVLFPIWSKLTECHNWHCQNVWRLALTWRIWSVRCHVSRVTRAGCTWTRPSRVRDTCENNATIVLCVFAGNVWFNPAVMAFNASYSAYAILVSKLATTQTYDLWGKPLQTILTSSVPWTRWKPWTHFHTIIL